MMEYLVRTCLCELQNIRQSVFNTFSFIIVYTQLTEILSFVSLL